MSPRSAGNSGHLQRRSLARRSANATSRPVLTNDRVRRLVREAGEGGGVTRSGRRPAAARCRGCARGGQRSAEAGGRRQQAAARQARPAPPRARPAASAFRRGLGYSRRLGFQGSWAVRARCLYMMVTACAGSPVSNAADRVALVPGASPDPRGRHALPTITSEKKDHTATKWRMNRNTRCFPSVDLV